MEFGWEGDPIEGIEVGRCKLDPWLESSTTRFFQVFYYEKDGKDEKEVIALLINFWNHIQRSSKGGVLFGESKGRHMSPFGSEGDVFFPNDILITLVRSTIRTAGPQTLLSPMNTPPFELRCCFSCACAAATSEVFPDEDIAGG